MCSPSTSSFNLSSHVGSLRNLGGLRSVQAPGQERHRQAAGQVQQGGAGRVGGLAVEGGAAAHDRASRDSQPLDQGPACPDRYLGDAVGEPLADRTTKHNVADAG